MQSMPFVGKCDVVYVSGCFICVMRFVTFLSGCRQNEVQIKKLMRLFCCGMAINFINNDNDLTFMEQEGV